MLDGDRVKNGSILLVSDLETAPDDVPETARVLRAIKRKGTPVRLLALGPSATLARSSAASSARRRSRRSPTGPSASPSRPTCAGGRRMDLLFLSQRSSWSRSRGTSATRGGSPGSAPEGGRMDAGLLHLRRELLLVVAAAYLVLAVLVALVAVDVAACAPRSRRTTCASPPVPPPAAGVRGSAPFDAAERLLGVRDDVAFRSMLQLLRSSRLLDYTVSDPVLAIRRTELAERLESIMVRDPDPALRSRVQPAGCGQRRLVELDGAQGAQQQDRSELLLAAVMASSRPRSTRRTTTRSTTSS